MSDFSRSVTHKACKPHCCDWCGEPIPVGEAYSYPTNVLDGRWANGHFHTKCGDACAEWFRYRSPDEPYSWRGMVRGEVEER